MCFFETEQLWDQAGEKLPSTNNLKIHMEVPKTLDKKAILNKKRRYLISDFKALQNTWYGKHQDRQRPSEKRRSRYKATQLQPCAVLIKKINVYECFVCIHVCMCTICMSGIQGVLGPRESELQMVESYHVGAVN